MDKIFVILVILYIIVIFFIMKETKIEALVINLDKRPDRWNVLKNKFSNIKTINLKRFSAITHEKGYIGCGLSHVETVKQRLDHNENILTIEDDCHIPDIPNFDKRWSNIKKWLDKNDDKWDIFLGGCTSIDEPLISKDNINLLNKELGIVSIPNAYAAHFIYYNKKFMHNIMKWNDKVGYAVDQFYFLYPGIRIATAVPFIATQNVDHSDIQNSTSDYTNLFTNAEQLILNSIN